MTNALRLYRAVVVGGEDPESLGRIRLSIVRNVRGVPTTFEGWATVGVAPMAAGVDAAPAYAPGDAVLYAAERLPFVRACVVCREGGSALGVPAAPLSIRLALGQGQEAKVESAQGALRISTTAGLQITLNPDGTLEVNANRMTLSASHVRVDAGMATFSGVVKCDTLIANTVMAATYTPGAGNLV